MKTSLKIRVITSFIAFISIGWLFIGCGKTEPDAAVAKQGITITDAAGRTVFIEQPVERVAILDNGTAEVLRALGVLDTLVGNHQSVADNPLYPEVQDVPVVATHSEINYEKLAEVRPQVVFSSVRAHGVIDEQEHLQGFNMKDVKLNLRNPDLMKDEILLLGRIFNKEEKARELVDFYHTYEQYIKSRVDQVALEDRPTLFVEYHAGDFKTGAPDSRFYQQTILAGAVNIASSLSGEPQVDGEWVAEQNPDVFLREASSFGYGVNTYDNAEMIYREIMERPALKNTTAVQTQSVYLVGVDIYSRPAYIVGVSYLAKWLYPDLFADFDPEQVHREYFELFHPGMPYDGLWTYSGMESGR